jgi:hypothetical protein
MKRSVFPLLILSLVLIFPARTGCPQEPGGGSPSGNLGDGPLVLKGRIYNYHFDLDETKAEYTYEPSNISGTVEVYTRWPDNMFNEKLGEWPLTNGELDISITKKPANLTSAADLFGWRNNSKVEPADARGAKIQLLLRLSNHSGNPQRSNTVLSGNKTNYSGTVEWVTYLYVDKDATITLGEYKNSGGDGNTSYTMTYNAAVLNLTQGWNALYEKAEVSYIAYTATPSSGTGSISVGNPDLHWVLGGW